MPSTNNLPAPITLTHEDALRILREEVPERLGITPEKMVDDFRSGRLDDPGDVIDLLGLCRFIDKGHPLHLEP